MDQVTRARVALRAGGRCEYCRLPEALRTPFTLEHIIAKQHRGTDALQNLAWACLLCNRYKGPNLTGIDPRTNKITRLFNPRRHAWQRHFRYRAGLVLGKTAIGRTTVEVLAMNEIDRVRLRQVLERDGIFPV